jgi:hypothetical protein
VHKYFKEPLKNHALPQQAKPVRSHHYQTTPDRSQKVKKPCHAESRLSIPVTTTPLRKYFKEPLKKPRQARHLPATPVPAANNFKKPRLANPHLSIASRISPCRTTPHPSVNILKNH